MDLTNNLAAATRRVRYLGYTINTLDNRSTILVGCENITRAIDTCRLKNNHRVRIVYSNIKALKILADRNARINTYREHLTYHIRNIHTSQTASPPNIQNHPKH